MVDYGMIVQNNSSKVIIDSTFKNHTYHSHGTSFVQQHLTAIDIPDITTTGLLFLKAPEFYVFPQGFEKNGSVYDKIVIASDSTGYVDWIVYEEFADTLNPEYGLNIYDSSASLVFSSESSGYVTVATAYAYGAVGANLPVKNTNNNYYALTGYDLSWSYSLDDPTWVSRENRGFKVVDSTTIGTALFEYYYEEDWLPVSSGFSSGNSSASPAWMIEIEPPPMI